MKQIIEIIKEEFNLDIDEEKIATSSDLYQFCKENQVEGTLIAWMYKKGKLWYDTAEKYEIDEKLINYDTSLKNYLKAAKYENLAAEAMLTKKYYFGESVKQDYQKALYWGNKILENIDIVKSEKIIERYFNEEEQEEVLSDIEFAKVIASMILFNMYFFGEGTKKDVEKAFLLVKSSAALGDAKFQYFLGQMYEEGEGTLPDYQKAILWYEEAIKNNFVEAELFYRLGNLYDKGLGTTPNKEKAKQLIEKALKMGYKPEE